MRLRYCSNCNMSTRSGKVYKSTGLCADCGGKPEKNKVNFSNNVIENSFINFSSGSEKNTSKKKKNSLW